MSTLKQLGDSEFKARNYVTAIMLYTQALDFPPLNEVLPTQTKRSIIANKALANLKSGSVHDALVDCNLALSPQYTTSDSSRELTAKLFLRRATVYEALTESERAHADFLEFSNIKSSLGQAIHEEDAKILVLIRQGLAIPPESYEMERIYLIRAIHARGILIPLRFLLDFPEDPSHESHGDTVAQFEDVVSGENYPQMPLLIPFRVMFPHLEDPQIPGNRFSGTVLISETDIIADHVRGIVDGFSITMGPGRAWIMEALEQVDPMKTKLLAVTRCGRILELPWHRAIGGIWAGGRWPRSSPSPLPVLRSPPNGDPKKVDGFEFQSGSVIQVYVVPQVHVRSFVDKLDANLKTTET
ncbi:hypothetical protein BDW22DRAFT_1487076 [Trametopsis cervina]|nr:hypothetical protein BDW22DRAFT_1487076 [Trametopsis cervina]